jgi:alkylation response protein AidB-like acyl-CoA dehydrogenase
MLVSLPPDALEFRARVREFLADSLDDELKNASRLTTGVHTHIDAGQRWYKILSKQGWIAPTWPKDFGGTGWNALERYIFGIECFRAGAPLLFNMGIRHLGPVLMAHGSDEQKNYYLPRILSGEDIWCQGYSEPTAGSDLASLKLKARRANDEYLLNGSKLWTTGAQFATHMFALVRTSDEGRKQQGITFLLVPMDTPGIEVKPIINLSGDHEVNQVFFDDVRVPVGNRVGPENEGWQVAKVLMQYARSNNINTGWVREALERLKRVGEIEKDGGGQALSEEESFRDQISEADMFLSVVEVMELRVLVAINLGESPGALSSMLKTLGSEVKQQITELTARAVGYYGFPFQPEALNPFISAPIIGPTHTITAMSAYLNERGATIYSGTSEVQRNVLAKQVLGL